jgi:hypothetical protein
MTESDRPMGLTDSLYLDPYVDVDEWRDEPVRYRYVHGGFADTECRFSIYFPEAKRYQGRFFHPVMPVPGTEHGATEGLYTGYIEFSVASGAYLVESNLGMARRALPGEDSTIAGYRASAAVAMYSRVLAAAMYGEHRPYGYVFGGSGGAYRTVDGQIFVAPTARGRKGIQPVVAVTANGGARADVAVGEEVEFSALVDVPPGAGTIVAAEWDFEGGGDFPDVVPFDNEESSYTAKHLTASHTFSEPGTYFPALRVTSQRLGQMNSPHGRIENLGRVRVVVGS